MTRARAEGGQHRGSRGKAPSPTIRASLLRLFRDRDAVSVKEAIAELRQFKDQQIRAALCGLVNDQLLEGSGNAWDGTKRYCLTTKGRALELARPAPKFTASRFAELCLAFFGRGMRAL